MNSYPPGFTHLRVHSHFSLLHATAAPEALVQRAAADGLQALALTDVDGLYGAVRFARACRTFGIQPVIGMTATVTTPPGEPALAGMRSGELVLLAKDTTGYRSLCALASQLQTAGARPSGLAWDTLRDHAQGLICLAGGYNGWIAAYLRAENGRVAARIAARLGAIYHEDLFLGLSPAHAQDSVARESVQIAARFGIRPVALQPVYCLDAADAARLRLLAAIRLNTRLSDLPSAILPPGTLHWQPAAAIAEQYATAPEALTAVGEIVACCGDALPDGRTIWPKLELPQGRSAAEEIAVQAAAGLAARVPPDDPQAGSYAERLQRELAAINRHGFAPLFLLVADITRFARDTAVPVNTRGSVANSLVAYSLGITSIDPVEHDLLFERFLNPARSSLPDIDLDFCSRRRDEVLAYVRRTHGADRMALVATISTLQPKSAVRETAKAYGLPERDIKRLTSKVQRRWHPDPRRREQRPPEEIATQFADPIEQEIILRAYEIVDQPDHLSVHPGGIVITPGPLTDFVPVQLAPKGFLTTQYDFRDLEDIGLPKIDLLGIRALTVLADTAELIRRHHDSAFQLEDIPLDDVTTGDLLSAADTIGVFQCESTGAQRTLRQLRARSVRDLAVANAFFKPGPATGGMAQAFVRRYRGEETVTFLHPALEPILGATQGVLLFQEQVLRIARDIAGLSWQQADHLRRGMSKFKAREMAAMGMQFMLGCQRKPPDGPGFTREQAQTLWEQVLAFAGYGFNQGHATAYADVSYRSAFLKAHYPAEFFCARLADYGGFHHPAVYMAEARRLGMRVMPPHVNISGKRFTLTFGDWYAAQQGAVGALDTAGTPVLWMGLSEVRDLRRTAVKAIVAARVQRPYASLRDLLARVDLQPKEVMHLVQCGALDGLGESRAALLAVAGQIARAGSARQMAFDFAEVTAVVPETTLQRLEWETAVLGQPLSASRLELAALPAGTLSVRAAAQTRGAPVAMAGVRLPGWTGGKGFFVGDDDSYTIVIPRQGEGGSKRDVWQPLLCHGRWQQDAWGGGWFAADRIELLPPG